MLPYKAMAGLKNSLVMKNRRMEEEKKTLAIAMTELLYTFRKYF